MESDTADVFFLVFFAAGFLPIVYFNNVFLLFWNALAAGMGWAI